jgi:hypothetical protein
LFAYGLRARFGRQVAEPHSTGTGTLTWLQRLWRPKDSKLASKGGTLNEDGGERVSGCG